MLLECRNLSLSYGDKSVLDDFSLTLPLEGITALKGPSGCGKTTLLRLIAGLESPARGGIRGISPRETAFLFQENRLFPKRTVEQHLQDVKGKRHQNDPAIQYRIFQKLTLCAKGNCNRTKEHNADNRKDHAKTKCNINKQGKIPIGTFAVTQTKSLCHNGAATGAKHKTHRSHDHQEREDQI